MIKKSLYNKIGILIIKRMVAITHPCYPAIAKHYFQGNRVTPSNTLVTGGGVTSFYTLGYMNFFRVTTIYRYTILILRGVTLLPCYLYIYCYWFLGNTPPPTTCYPLLPGDGIDE